MKRILIISATLVVILIGFVVGVSGNDTDDVMLESKYRFLFVNGHQANGNEACLSYSDSLLSAARKSHDKKVMALGYVLQTKYWSQAQNESKMTVAFDAGRQCCIESNYNEAMVYLYEQIITYYNTQKEHDKTLIACEKLLQDAQNSPFAQWTAYRWRGLTYRTIKDLDKARTSLSKALEAYEHLPKGLIFTQQPTEIYRLRGEIGTSADEKMMYFNEGLRHAKTQRDSARLIRNKALSQLAHNDTAGFKQSYAALEQIGHFEDYFAIGERDVIIALHYVVEHDREKAYATLENIQSDKLRYNYQEYIARRCDDWKTAYETRLKYDELENTEYLKVYDSSTDKFASEFGNDKLKEQLTNDKETTAKAEAEQRKSEANTAIIQAEKAKVENQHKLLEDENNKREAANKLLTLEAKNKETETQKAYDIKAKADMQAKLMTQEARAAQEDIRQTRNMIVLIGGSLLLVVLFLWVVVRHRTHKKLKNSMNLLRQAHMDEKQAAHAKDEFIYGMSIAIRDPLNGVLGVTQALTAPGVEFNDDEKVEMGSNVEKNVNLLTSIVDDILNVSDIESGNFSLYLSSYDVRELCESAITLTQYRVENGVTLSFNNQLPEGYTAVLDAHRMQQTLVCLLGNSCKFTRKGSITLSVNDTTKDGFLSFIIKDTNTRIKKYKHAGGEKVVGHWLDLSTSTQYTEDLVIPMMIIQKIGGEAWLDIERTDGVSMQINIPLNLTPTE